MVQATASILAGIRGPYACYAGTSAMVPTIVVVRLSVAEPHRAAVTSSAHSAMCHAVRAAAVAASMLPAHPARVPGVCVGGSSREGSIADQINADSEGSPCRLLALGGSANIRSWMSAVEANADVDRPPAPERTDADDPIRTMGWRANGGLIRYLMGSGEIFRDRRLNLVAQRELVVRQENVRVRLAHD